MKFLYAGEISVRRKFFMQMRIAHDQQRDQQAGIFSRALIDDPVAVFIAQKPSEAATEWTVSATLCHRGTYQTLRYASDKRCKTGN
ncbi:hypothetical protein PQR11_24125 [Paraburkholderia strydomiana]|uniref:hypothetical protein n=1 Tax=Paraburkholderia strydomiana TaxID=1245417 RepID=UPI0038B80F39